MSDNILIVEPGGFGDVLIVLPIAAHFKAQGHTVTMLVQDKILPLAPYVPYVSLKNIVDEEEFDKKIDLELGSENSKLATNKWRKENKRHFDEWKYDTAGVPFEEKFKLKHGLNVAASATLMAMFGLTYQKYVVMCAEDSEGRQKRLVDFAEDAHINKAHGNLPIFEIGKLDGFTILDWAMVIRNAAYGYFVDSAFANFVNGSGLLVGNRAFMPNPPEKWGEHTTICTPVLDEGWTAIMAK